jgi:hypothetical protein
MVCPAFAQALILQALDFASLNSGVSRFMRGRYTRSIRAASATGTIHDKLTSK